MATKSKVCWERWFGGTSLASIVLGWLRYCWCKPASQAWTSSLETSEGRAMHVEMCTQWTWLPQKPAHHHTTKAGSWGRRDCAENKGPASSAARAPPCELRRKAAS